MSRSDLATLSPTGVELGLIIIVGLGLLVAGTLVIVLSRRRSR